MQRLIYHAWLKRESLLRDNRSHAPCEVRSKCLDLSSICIADKHPIEDCIKAGLTIRQPRGRIAVLNNQTIVQIENQNFVVIGAGTPLWEK